LARFRGEQCDDEFGAEEEREGLEGEEAGAAEGVGVEGLRERKSLLVIATLWVFLEKGVWSWVNSTYVHGFMILRCSFARE
jgi:hypothetical protein